MPAPKKTDKTQYRVLSGGISTPHGPAWRGDVVDGAYLGDAARVRALLVRGSIEVVTDDVVDEDAADAAE